jgi:tRNA modification GTPase
LAGKLDLVQAEAVMDLIEAASPVAVRSAAAQLGGQVSRAIADIRTAITDILAHFYAVCDYSDADLAPFDVITTEAALNTAIKTLYRLESGFRRGKMLQSGVAITLMGRPNSGKSTLFNALAGAQRAIVTDEPGTTRDVLELPLTLDGMPVRLRDTAGLREAVGEAERIGVAMAADAVAESQAVIVLIDATRSVCDEDIRALQLSETIQNLTKNNRMIAFTKMDICTSSDMQARINEIEALGGMDIMADTQHIAISAQTGQGLEALIRWMTDRARDQLGGDDPIITSARQAALMTAARQDLENAVQSLRDGLTPDAFLSDAERSVATLGQITGETAAPDMAAEIFSRFCVGK